MSGILRHTQSVNFTKICGPMEKSVGPTVRTCLYGALTPSLEDQPPCKSLFSFIEFFLVKNI